MYDVSSMNWRPVELEVMLHCYYSPEAVPRFREAPSIQNAAGKLQRLDLLSPVDEQGGALGDNCFRATSKGKFFVKMLLTTPEPLLIWVDPRERLMKREDS